MLSVYLLNQTPRRSQNTVSAENDVADFGGLERHGDGSMKSPGSLEAVFKKPG
jgi:hypothetical protein